MYNKAILIGRLVATPELKSTQNGVPVTSFRIAVNRPMKDDKTDFLNVTAWRQAAEFVCRYFTKGRLIGVEGQVQTRDFTDKDGNKRTAFEIVADRCFFTESLSSSGSAPVPAPAQAESDGFDGDLPF